MSIPPVSAAAASAPSALPVSPAPPAAVVPDGRIPEGRGAADLVAPAIEAAPASGARPNPRIEFDAKLGIAVLEYQNSRTHAVTYYPAAARQDLGPSDWDVSA